MKLKLIKIEDYENDIDYYNWRDGEVMDENANYLCIDEESVDEIVGTLKIYDIRKNNYISFLESKYERIGIGSFIVKEILKERKFITGTSLHKTMPFWESFHGIKFDEKDYDDYKEEKDFAGYIDFRLEEKH